MSLNNASGVIIGDQNFSLPSHMNFGKYFVDQITKYCDKVAMINGATGEQITHRELIQQIVNTAASLQRLGVKRGEVVAICSENRIDYMITTIAVYYIGAVCTFINMAYSKGEFIHVINISKPRYVFFSLDAYKVHFVTLVKLKIVRKFFIYGNDIPKDVKATYFKDISSIFTDINVFRWEDFYGRRETALILYSSGTTGLPKGAKLSNVNLIVTAQQPRTTNRDITILSVAPWCTCMGQNSTLDALIEGKTFVFLPKFEENLYLKTIENYKAGLLIVVPPIVVILSKSAQLDKHDVSSVEIVYSGGAPLDPETIDLARTRFPNLTHILQGYGMTEATGAVSDETDRTFKQGSVGTITPGNVIKIVDTETGKTLGSNQRGELCVKGPVLFEGYIGKTSELDDEGFFKTGDIAYYDEEGFIFIVDRLKELIKYKAWQVAPSELEAVLLQHPAVKDVGVVGILNKATGEVPMAFVVKQPEGKVTEKELVDFVASNVSPWKRLRGGVKFINVIPKTGSGKILRRKLRDSLQHPASKL